MTRSAIYQSFQGRRDASIGSEELPHVPLAATWKPTTMSSSHLDLNLPPSGKEVSPTKIYQAEDFDDAIINAMNSSSEKVDEEYGDAAKTHQTSRKLWINHGT